MNKAFLLTVTLSRRTSRISLCSEGIKLGSIASQRAIMSKLECGSLILATMKCCIA